MPYRTIAEQALARWRAAQARLDTTPQHSPEWEAARTEAELAKGEYHDAVDAALREHLPGPPPFPDHDEAHR
jgi:hypothetical protein